MQFGFSIGDILLCAQIAHRLYSAVTDGRKTAPRDLKELDNVLFGLYCSLNHLHRASQTILAKAANKSDQDGINMKQQLGFMIRSCLQTLNELDKVTQKYRDAADDPPPLPGSQYGVVGVPFSQQFRVHAKIQWRRFMWDLKGDSLSRYREKLQGHADTINLLLNTFIWSATDRLEEDGRRQTQKIDELLHQATHCNSIISQLMQNVHATMSTPQRAFTLPHQTPSKAIPGSSSALTITDLSGDSYTGTAKDIPMTDASHASASTHAHTTQPSSSYAGINIPSGVQFRPNERPFRLPEMFHVINETRRVVGMKEFSAYRHLNRTPSLSPWTVTEQNDIQATSQSIQQLRGNLEHLFLSIHVSADTTTHPNETPRIQIINWVNKLENVLVSFQSSFPNLPEQEVNDIIQELTKLLVSLNRWIEKGHDTHKKTFYEASGSRLDHSFDTLKDLSAQCQKEIEEFEDERDEWRQRMVDESISPIHDE